MTYTNTQNDIYGDAYFDNYTHVHSQTHSINQTKTSINIHKPSYSSKAMPKI